MKLSGRRGRLRMNLAPIEAEILGELFDALDRSLDGINGRDDAIFQRLYPAAYRDDDEAATEFRSLTEDALRAERHERVEACRTDLADSLDVDVGEPDTAQRWIQVLNDLRLAVGTSLGITADDPHDVDPRDLPEGEPRVIYYFLTAVQDELVQALLR